MTIKGYAKIYMKIECKNGEVGSSSFDFDFSNVIDEAFFQKLLDTCFDAAADLGYDPVSVSMISKEEYDDIKINESVSYNMSDRSFEIEYSTNHPMKKDLVLQFAVLWGCARGVSACEGDEHVMKILTAYESDELQVLFNGWADEYIALFENGDEPDVTEMFESKIADILLD